MKLIGVVALSIASLAVAVGQETARKPGTQTGSGSVSTNESFSKGGLGIVTAHLYIDVISAKNELVLDDGVRWVGQDSHASQVVFFFENKVWTSVPPGFDLGKSVLVSFENDVVRFFDFAQMSGGYYRKRMAM